MAEAEYRGIRGTNFFLHDQPLLAWLKRRKAPKDAVERLTAFGELCGGKLDELIGEAHKDEKLPRLERYDRWGGRIDEIRYCPEQLDARRLVLQSEVLLPTPLWERLVKAYLVNQCGEGGVTCPLAMTDGLARLLEEHGTPEQKKRWLPLVRDPKSPTPLTGGQFVTEKQGGSVVSENETRAVAQKDGTWRLTGLKWFCSNPGELWVTTAKPEGSDTVALFLVPRLKPDGSLNDCHILRLKDLCGTRGKATAEVEYTGAYAELVGRPSHGLAILMKVVIATSRMHVAAGSLGMMRRAMLEAGAYARTRRVMGRPAAELPEVKRSLARIEALWRGAQAAFFEMIRALEDEDPVAEVLVPLLKIGISRAATEAVREAQLVFAGNGILRDFSILPRLSQDALIQEIWEGTHAVLAGHVEKALRRKDSRRAFEALVGRLPDLEGLALCEAGYAALTRSLSASGRKEAKVL
ncbi:MAG: acyl-CoA dehydrogenase family protein [Elusimicrobia bacterium]|nr:acyl-CoA dehydrogenase family protein [Elusimicrobiota bacterium]